MISISLGDKTTNLEIRLKIEITYVMKEVAHLNCDGLPHCHKGYGKTDRKHWWRPRKPALRELKDDGPLILVKLLENYECE